METISDITHRLEITERERVRDLQMNLENFFFVYIFIELNDWIAIYLESVLFLANKMQNKSFLSKVLRWCRPTLEADTAGRMFDGDLHGGETPGLYPLSVRVVAVLECHRPLSVGSLPAAGTVLAEARPLHS